MTRDAPVTPIHVVHVITDLDVGGAELSLLRLVSAANPSLRHEVVSLRAGGVLEQHFSAADVPVTNFDVQSAAGLAAAILKLRRLLRRRRPAVLMTWLYHADLAGTIASLLLPGVHLVWNIRCADMDLSHYRRTTRLLPGLLARLSRLPALVITNSEAGRRAHLTYGYRPRRWEVVQNGVDTRRFRPDADRRRAVRAEFGLREDAPLVGMIARFDPMKDHRTFLEAANIVAAYKPEARFLLVGRGTDGAAFELLVKDSGLAPASLLRLGERRDVESLLPALDAAVSASLTEGFPNAVAEAMASGVPCVVTNAGDSALLVAQTGRTVPVSSPAELARAILELLELPLEEWQKLSIAARDRMVNDFAEARCWRRYFEIFSSV